MSGKPRVLAMIDWYLPGYKGGGPIRSVAHIAAALCATHEFKVITSDADYGETQPYPGIAADTWTAAPDGTPTWYCSGEARSYRHIRTLIAETDFDVLYLNSMFSLRFTLYPLWVARSTKPEATVILAPRGMLHAGALSLKPLKKRLFLGCLRLMGLHKQLIFHATDAQEEKDVQQVFGVGTQVVTAANLPSREQPPFRGLHKVSGELKLLFLSRISEKKGVHLLLAALHHQTARIQLDIVGPDEEPGYWARCATLVATLPPNVQVRKLPPVAPDQVQELLQAAHLFVMPTLGENFGHAIFEALSAGRPVLISDQTPWRDLEPACAGADLSLADEQAWAAQLGMFAEMEAAAWERYAQGAYGYAKHYRAESPALAATRELFAARLKG
jgi:glycosyltransferase involved in cell wall biosynthesis